MPYPTCHYEYTSFEAFVAVSQEEITLFDAGKMKLAFLENPSSTLLGYSRISNLFQAQAQPCLDIQEYPISGISLK